MQLYTVKPIISVVAAGLACVTEAGSTTVTSSALFGSVVAGQRVHGPGIQFGTKVASVESTSSITLDKPAKLGGSVTLQFGYFASAAYVADDCLGFPFEIPLTEIKGITVIDKIKQITAVKMYVFSAEFSTPLLDNAAFAPVDADAANIIGYYSLTGNKVLTNNHVIHPAQAELPLPKYGSHQKMFGQLVVVGTPTFTSISDLVVSLCGE